MTTAERMKHRRKELGLSAEYVADRLGCSATTIYRYEKGDIEKMPVDILKPLSVILHTTSAYLMGLDDFSSASSAEPAIDPATRDILSILSDFTPEELALAKSRLLKIRDSR